MKIKAHQGCEIIGMSSIPVITTAMTKTLKSNFPDE